MNPNSILARETRLPAQAARRQQATRAELTRSDFQLPEPATDAPDRRAPVARDRDDRTATRIDRSRPENPDRAQGPRDEDMRGSQRSREVRRDGEARDGKARDDRPVRGEGPERRSDRADEVSSRDKVKPTGGGDAEASQESGTAPSSGQPVSAEAAALDLLAKGEAATGEAMKSAEEMTVSPDAPDGGEASGQDALSPLEATVTPQPSAGLSAPAPAETKTEAAAAEATPGAAIGENGQKPPRSAATLLPVTGGETKDAATDQTASPEDAAAPATAQDQPDVSGKAPAEAAQTATRPTHEAKAETGQGPFQAAAARLEALPPGLAALPDNARALQAQLSEARPQAGAHPHGAGRPEPSPTSLSALPIEIGFRALEGTKRFDIRLDPAELGRVDVSLSFDKDGEVTAKLTVDRVETLHLLHRDARTLERAFDQAGLRTSDAGVQITLSDRNAGQEAGQGGGFQAEQERARHAGRRDDAEQKTAAITEIIPQRRLRPGGVDLNI